MEIENIFKILLGFALASVPLMLAKFIYHIHKNDTKRK